MKFLLPTLQHAFPTAIHYEPLASPIVQANAEGQLVSVFFEDDEDDVSGGSAASTKKSCFVKTVDAHQYNEKKSWPDLRRTLMYLRTEVRFYQEVLPDLQSAIGGEGGVSTPEIFAAGYDLDGLLTEEERATDDPTKGPVSVDWSDNTCSTDDDDTRQKKGGYIVMEAVSDAEYMQDSPITIPQAKEALETIAAFHASAWENKSLLEKAQDRLSKGSYHLKTRNPKEVAGLPESWTEFSKNFGIEDDEGDENLGKRIQDLAEYICDETSPAPTDPYATLSHGDCKAMNCFLPVHKEGQTDDGSAAHRGAILVDFASTGVGLGMSDVAMLINHAVKAKDLDNGGEEMLIDHYLDALNKKLLSQQRLEGGDGRPEQQLPAYPREIALWHYKLAVADYFRFFLGRFWKTATPEAFEKKKDSKNTALINRDLEAALRFLGRAKTFVSEIETKRGQSA